MDNMITCPSCGALLPPGIKHCTECGAKIASPEAETAAEGAFAAEAAPAEAAPADAAAKAEEALSEAEAVFGAPFAQQPPSVLLGDMAAAEDAVSQEKPEPAYPSQTTAPAYTAPSYTAPSYTPSAVTGAPASAPASAGAPSPYAPPAAAAAAPAPAAPAYAPQAAPAYQPQAAAPAYPPQTAASAYPAAAPAAYAQPAAEDPDKPDKKSKYAPMTSLGMAVELFLMSIPVVGFVLMIIWSCGVCRKIARRNLARAYLILLIAGLVAAVILAILGRFVFKDQLTQIVEQLLPGYTIQWG